MYLDKAWCIYELSLLKDYTILLHFKRILTKIIHAALPWFIVDVSLELESKKNHFYSCLFSLASHLTYFSDSEKNPKKREKISKKKSGHSGQPEEFVLVWVVVFKFKRKWSDV